MTETAQGRQRFRVVWKREGLRSKAKRYVNRGNAERLMNILTSPEPWKFYVKPAEADDYACCDGHECGCGGVTVKEESDEKHKDLPKLEWVRLETRSVTPWKATGVEFIFKKPAKEAPEEVPF